MWRVWRWIQGLRSHLWRWGFCTIRSLPPACRRRVVALLVQFPPRLVAVSLESRSRPGPSALSDPFGERRIFGDGGFAALEASRRRVAGVSWLYWCNFPRLVAPSTWAKLNRVPLTAQFPRLVAPSTWAELDHAPLMVQFPPFGGALDVGQAQPCTSHSASPPVW